MKRITSLLAMAVAAVMAAPVMADHVWINEFHYDNTGADANEFVEIAVRSGQPFSAADYSVILYNGAGGASYDTRSLSVFSASGNFPIAGGSNTVQFYSFNYTGAGASIQNGAPDGIALVYLPTTTVLSFLSYEGAFTATNGAASGMLSTDVGVSESGAVAGTSLSLTGSGNRAAHFAWGLTATQTAGAPNLGQTFVIPEPSSMGLLAAAGAIGLLALRRRRRK